MDTHTHITNTSFGLGMHKTTKPLQNAPPSEHSCTQSSPKYIIYAVQLSDTNTSQQISHREHSTSRTSLSIHTKLHRSSQTHIPKQQDIQLVYLQTHHCHLHSTKHIHKHVTPPPPQYIICRVKLHLHVHHNPLH